MLKQWIALSVSILLSSFSQAEEGKIQPGGTLSTSQFRQVVHYCQTHRPRFWGLLVDIRDQDVQIILSNERKGGPGKAGGKHRIVLSTFYLMNDLPQYPEDRLMIVLLHEYGHILYNRQKDRNDRSRVANEFAAFRYSLEAAGQLAKKGDAGPLREALHRMEARSRNGRPDDPHTIALKQLTNDPLWQASIRLLANTETSHQLERHQKQ
ncbi:hypothetical protein [Kistimonas asteriae]|uniref:hypothetical protein n=1 Tax=Kistimonas asteriae TaxID=517724 RepID=UPI001BAC74C1|nr:hypothetical protein [Kistimonas asteriae]